MLSRSFIFPTALVAGLALLPTTGCDLFSGDGESGSKDGEKGTVEDGEKGEAKGAETAAAGAEKLSPGEAAVEHAIDEANKELSEDARFDKELQRKGCELLTPKMVADTFDVAEGELKQMKIMGCVYAWSSGDEVVEARVSMLMSHKSEKGAASWFENATRSLTKEELAAQMEQVKAKVKERKEIDTKLKEKTADSLVDIATGMTPDEGIQYEPVSGIGDQAAVNLGEGTIWIRVDNLTFSVGAFKGKKMPQPAFDAKNPKAIIAASQKAQKEWMKETAAQRRVDAEKVAKLVVAGLD